MSKTSKKLKYFKGQKFGKLKRSCSDKKRLFEDREFVPSNRLLGSLLGRLPGTVEWKRPTEICQDPQLVVDKLNCSNIEQGCLGNCWFVASICALAKEKDLWVKVVPNFEAQNYGSSRHFGIFRFRFWRFGQWIEVVIDDRLPTVSGQLIFAHSLKKNEFWCSLLEKAYAKLFGSYEALEGNSFVDALLDLTAGFAERVRIENERTDDSKRQELFAHLKEERKHHSLMCCAISNTSKNANSAKTKGLLIGHAYCITDVRTVDIKKTGLFAFYKRERLNMIRLRNPWGEKEWNGPFSDRQVLIFPIQDLTLYLKYDVISTSLEWSKVTKSDREKCGMTFADDGEFWMTFDDFCKHFTDLGLCYLVNTSWFSFSQSYCEVGYFGSWSNGPKGSETDRSGGCSNHPNTFLQNPQYFFDVKYNDEKLLIMLQQKDLRGELASNARPTKLLSMGFQIVKVEWNRKYRLHKLIEIVDSSDFLEARTVLQKFRLSQGRYALIPVTFRAQQVGNYILRVFSKNNINLRQINLDGPRKPALSFLSRKRVATRIRVVEGTDIKLPGSTDVLSTYFIIICETDKVRSSVQKSSANPKWNEGGVFFRNRLNSRLKIQLWNSRPVKDVMLSEVDVDPPGNDRLIAQRVTLMSVKQNGEKENREVVGKLLIEMFSTEKFSTV